MFAMFSAFFAALTALFNGTQQAAESINNLATLGRIKTDILLKEEIDNAGVDLRQLRQDLADLGITEMTQPKITSTAPKRATKATA